MNSNNDLINKITPTNLENFKKLVRRAIFLEGKDEQYFNSIPDDNWKAIFATNFNANLEYARRVMFNRFDEIEKLDLKRVDSEKNKIHNLGKATNMVLKSIDDNSPIIFITDFDNDGSLAQSIINEYLKIDKLGSRNMHVEYAQTVNGNSNRGLTVDLVEKIIEYKNINPENKFLIITADNGINSREEQIKIHKRFPNAEILITDHHNPDPEMVILENEKAIIFNPQYKPTPFFQKNNISGASTVGVLLKNVLKNRYSEEQLNEFKPQLENIQKLFKVSNLLDYVKTDPVDKPEKDYVITKFLQLQPLLNINNSISKIITGEIPASAIQAIKEKITNLNTELLYEEAKNIHIQNNVAKILLNVYAQYQEFTPEEIQELKGEDFTNDFLKEMNNADSFANYEAINPNFIEQLRPLIFGLTADDYKNAYLDELNDAMIKVFESIKTSEQKMAQELRQGEVITKTRLSHSFISYADENILSIFNRKFLNKVYNDENPGFSLTLDSLSPTKVSGSFRSLYDISDILKDKKKLEKLYKIKIETPGHERAAGFIVKSTNPKKYPINSEMIEGINTFINNSIIKIKENEIKEQKTYLLTDLQAITLIDRINVAIRGNISNFERITPLLKLTPDSVWTDKYSTKQYSMEDICNEKKYGYITIGINFHGDTVIVPVELVRRIVQNDYKDYMSLGYMDGGVFMADRVILSEDVNNIIDLRNKNTKTEEIFEVFEKDFKDKNYVELSREQIKDNPFYKYSDYGDLNFDLFEKMVIGIIDTNFVDTLAVFDVEANGFGNAKLMNFGSMNYYIDPDSGTVLNPDDFYNRFFATERGEEYLLTEEEMKELRPISATEKDTIPLNVRKLLLVKNNDIDTTDGYTYYLHPEAEKALNDSKIQTLPFLAVKNHIENEQTGLMVINREIKATMLAYLINDNDFKVPQEMTNLTGITQELLRKYGKPSSTVDKEIVDFYSDKTVLFGAHNTPYDAKVLRANTPALYELLKNSLIYDSALFSRQEKLAYDEIKVSKFVGIDGMPNIYFYNNHYSDFNLTNFLLSEEDGLYPDRTGQYLLEREDGNYYIVDKAKHEKVRLQFSNDKIEMIKEIEQNELTENNESVDLTNITKKNIRDKIKGAENLSLNTKVLLMSMDNLPIPNTAIKYSVEKLSEQWMIHSLQLSDENFDIKHVDLNQEKYQTLKPFEDALAFFQNNYHFDTSPENNLYTFLFYYEHQTEQNENFKPIPRNEELYNFINDFLEINKSIQQKFSDSWMYKKVLTIKDPKNSEITNDLVDLVNYQTNIPKDKIREIFETAVKFKDKHNIDHIIHHEGHINGPWEGDSKGDVAFEDKLTLSLLAKRRYDSYTHNIKDALNTFNKYVIEARKSFDKSDELSAYLANDSYSFRQGLLYDRKEKTEMIQTVQSKEKALEEGKESNIVKFKMGNTVLPPDTGVYAVTRPGQVIDREIIESDSEKLAFIVVNEQLKSSLQNSKLDKVTFENTLNILTSNDIISIKYKKELSERYKYIEFNKKDYQLTKFLEGVEEALYDPIDGMKKLKKKKINEIDKTGFEIIHRIVINYVDGINRYNHNKIDINNILAVANHIEKLKIECPETRLEIALKEKTISFNNFDEVRDINFLKDLDITRRNPIKNLLKDHSQMRLINKFIEEAQNQCFDLDNINPTPKSLKM